MAKPAPQQRTAFELNGKLYPSVEEAKKAGAEEEVRVLLQRDNHPLVKLADVIAALPDIVDIYRGYHD